MKNLKRIEQIFYISVELFLGVYCTISPLKTDKFSQSILFTIIAIALYMISFRSVVKLILKIIADDYFYEDTEKRC